MTIVNRNTTTADYLDQRDKGALPEPITATNDDQPLDEAPAPKPNGSAPCYFCKRTRAEGCVCSITHPSEAYLREMKETHAIATKITEQRKAHEARMAELEAEAEEIGDDPSFVTITCSVCGEKYQWAANDSVDLCGPHRAEEYRRTHKEAKVKCKGVCGQRWPKQLLDEQGMCEGCAEAEPTGGSESTVIYAALSGPQGKETHKFSLMGHLASSTMPQPIRWIWEQRFPAGKLALLNGPQGSGKSMLFIDIIAHVTTGRDWPDAAKKYLGAAKSPAGDHGRR